MKWPNPAMHRTGSARHASCLRTSHAALRRSVILFSLGRNHPHTMNTNLRFLICILVLCGLAPHCFARSSYIRFKTKGTNQSEDFQRLRGLQDQVRKRLLADERLVSAYAGAEMQAKREMFHQQPDSWPLYGVKGSEFEGLTVNADFISHDLWISIACQTSDLSSKKVNDLKALISTAIGDEAMKHFEISVETEPFLNLRP